MIWSAQTPNATAHERIAMRAVCDVLLGDVGARSVFVDTLRVYADIHDLANDAPSIRAILGCWAMVDAATGRPEAVAVAEGIARRVEQQSGTPIPRDLGPMEARARDRTRAGLGARRYDELVRSGEEMSDDAAMTFLLEGEVAVTE